MMRTLRAIATVALCLGLVGLVGNWLYYRYSNVTASFAFVTGSLVQIGSPLDGQIEAVDVDLGGRVNEGQILVRLNRARMEAQVEQARSTLNEALARVLVARRALAASQQTALVRRQELESHIDLYATDVRAANIDVRLTQEQVERSRELEQSGLATQAEIGVLLSTAQRAQEGVQRAKDQLALAHVELGHAATQDANVSTQRAQVSLLEAAAQTAAAALRGQEAELELATVRAPRPGVVTRKLVDAGSAVRIGNPMLEIWYEGDAAIEAWIDESKYGRVQVGAPAVIRLLGMDRQPLSGRVEWVGVVSDSELREASFSIPVAQSLGKSRWLRARIQLDPTDVQLLPGLTADVSLPPVPPGAVIPPAPRVRSGSEISSAKVPFSPLTESIR